ncbi:single-stranded-DNA-specific exonuclease RecJ [Eubacterium multiforme]|uniref:Single-stranded-DNA-specific exonuclease RecJ n=1 Tax=Eubacterium multiforme TaxID=83339 RepID=A0ABT9UTQ0_9FIRM|nr:single-stranded-DNA-specific exonuclease RecJ [Eubacterium multiforme]MDQ0149707.1 single-stranded-DNA-specific exonuclease [Eubacterium multiforme]
MKEKWLVRNKKDEFQSLAKDMDENSLILRLLANRGISDKKSASLFLKGTVADMHDSFLMKDLKLGVDIIKDAIEKGKKIVIYGDYDCDGVCSTAILYKGLKRLNANFEYHIPNRESEGYGMNSERIKILKEEGAEILLTCDNGISAFEEVEYAKSLGLTVIITDHHDIPYIEEEGVRKKAFPKGDAVINPKREDCKYPFKSLCGAGVAFKFIQGLYKEFNINNEESLNLLEYAAIATVCDVVELLDENRIIVKKGLELINNTKTKGLKELINVKNLKDKKISEYHFGFVLGPCINATGRLEIADISVELLITEDEEKAKELAIRLNELNEKRQELTMDSTEKVIEKVESTLKPNEKVILVYQEDIHESIAGIVAGRVREKYNLPTIVMTKGSEMPKGSGRSIEEYNMFFELSKCKNLMEKFGGHPMAAGLSMKEENIPLLRKALNDNCTLTDEDVIPKVIIDAKLSLEYIDFDLVNKLNEMKPFGKGNGSPLFAVKDVLVKRVIFMGKEKNFLRFKLQMKDGKTIDGVNFNKYDYFKELFSEKYGEEEFMNLQDRGYCNFNMDILYYPEINEFNGKQNIQLSLKSFRL